MKELRLFLRKIDQKVISKGKHYLLTLIILYLKSASNLNGNLNCSKELEHYAS